MGSAGLCTALSVYGMLARSWASFKFLQLGHYTVPHSASQSKITIQPNNIASASQVNGSVEVAKTGRLSPQDSAAAKQNLLAYWTVFGVECLYEYYVECFLCWIPFYFTFKFCFLAFIVSEKTNGANVVFEEAIKPSVYKIEIWCENVLLPNVRAKTLGLFDIVSAGVAPTLTDEQLQVLINRSESLLLTLHEEQKLRKSIQNTIQASSRSPNIVGNTPSLLSASQDNDQPELQVPVPLNSSAPTKEIGYTKALYSKLQSWWATDQNIAQHNTIDTTTALKKNDSMHQDSSIEHEFEGSDFDEFEVALEVENNSSESSSDGSSDEDDSSSSSSSDSDTPTRAQKKEIKKIASKIKKAKLAPALKTTPPKKKSTSPQKSTSPKIRNTSLKIQQMSSNRADPNPGSPDVQNNMELNKYEQGFESLKEIEDESPVKTGRSYMESVIQMMQGKEDLQQVS